MNYWKFRFLVLHFRNFVCLSMFLINLYLAFFKNIYLIKYSFYYYTIWSLKSRGIWETPWLCQELLCCDMCDGSLSCATTKYSPCFFNGNFKKNNLLLKMKQKKKSEVRIVKLFLLFYFVKNSVTGLFVSEEDFLLRSRTVSFGLLFFEAEIYKLPLFNNSEFFRVRFGLNSSGRT